MFIKKSVVPFLFLFSHLCSADITVTDDSNSIISLQQPATRIVSLSPGTTELIFAAGGGKYVKGVVSYSDYPPAAKSLPQVGSYNAIDLEKILSLKPDLIVAWESGNPPLQISKLKKMGFTVFMSEPRDFADIPKTLRNLGRLMHTEKVAESNAHQFESKLKSLEEKFTGKFETKSVFIQIWNEPVMSVSGKHLISKIIEKCNGENIFKDYPQLTLSPNIETIIVKNPDIIIASREGKIGKKWLKRWKKWPFLTAVKNGHLFTANPDNLVRHTPRVLQGMEQVCLLINKP